MNDEFGTCPLCHGDKCRGVTTFAVDLGTGVVMVREVPALVCTQCGAPWIEDAVAARLETIVDEARAKHALVEVTHWPEVA